MPAVGAKTSKSLSCITSGKSNCFEGVKSIFESFSGQVFEYGKNVYLCGLNRNDMYWTLELASSLDDAPWPATKEELIDYANRSGAPEEVIENLQELEEEGEIYETIEDIWPDYPTKEDFFFNEEEY